MNYWCIYVLLLLNPLFTNAGTFYQGVIYVERGQSTTVELPTSLVNEYQNFSGSNLKWKSSNSCLIVATSAQFHCSIQPKSGMAFANDVQLKCTFNSWYNNNYMTTEVVWDVILKEPVTSITLNVKTCSLSVGGKKQIEKTITPTNATNINVTWKSSDNSVAIVNNGLVTAISEGKATITCSAQDGSNCQDSCVVYVGDFSVYDDELDEPDDDWSNIGNYNIDWYTSNKNNIEYTLTTNKELAGLAYLVNNGYYEFKGVTIKLGADIDLTGKYWSPIGYGGSVFRGSFDGQGHSIKGIYIHFIPDQRVFGFFGSVSGESSNSMIYIKNTIFKGVVNVQDANYSSIDITTCIGGVSGSLTYVSLEDCICYMPISFRFKDKGCVCRIGGIAGGCNMSVIHHCKYKGNISLEENKYACDKHYIGGVIGYSYRSKIEYSENISDVIKYIDNSGTGKDEQAKYIGAISGYYNELDISSISYCRSIIGEIYLSNNFSYSIHHDWIYTVQGVRGINCYCSISKITCGSPKVYDTLDLKTSGWSCFMNSDLTTKGWGGKLTNLSSVSTAFTSEQMKTPAFLNQLNKYSRSNLGEPIWTQDEGGFPYIDYETVDVRPVLQEKTIDSQHYYSLTGQQLKTPQKGINIVGGKKVIVK